MYFPEVAQFPEAFLGPKARSLEGCNSLEVQGHPCGSC